MIGSRGGDRGLIHRLIFFSTLFNLSITYWQCLSHRISYWNHTPKYLYSSTIANVLSLSLNNGICLMILSLFDRVNGIILHLSIPQLTRHLFAHLDTRCNASTRLSSASYPWMYRLLLLSFTAPA